MVPSKWNQLQSGAGAWSLQGHMAEPSDCEHPTPSGAVIPPWIIHEHNKEPHLLKKLVLMNDALTALLWFPQRFSQMLEHYPHYTFSRICSSCFPRRVFTLLFPASLGSQGSKADVFEHCLFGATLPYLPLKHLSELLNLVGVFI